MVLPPKVLILSFVAAVSLLHVPSSMGSGVLTQLDNSGENSSRSHPKESSFHQLGSGKVVGNDNLRLVESAGDGQTVEVADASLQEFKRDHRRRLRVPLDTKKDKGNDATVVEPPKNCEKHYFTSAPNQLPSGHPSKKPTNPTTNQPTKKPSNKPSNVPSNVPSITPFNTPSYKPSEAPSAIPSSTPSALREKKNRGLTPNPSASPTATEPPSAVVERAPTPIPTAALTMIAGSGVEVDVQIQDVNRTQREHHNLILAVAYLVGLFVLGAATVVGIRHVRAQKRRSLSGSPSANDPLVD